MCDYIPEDVVIGILKRLPVKSLGKQNYSLRYDNDVFDKFKQLQFPPFGRLFYIPVVGSCNGLICVRLYPFGGNFNFLLWNPSIQKYISLPHVKISNVVCLNVGFGFDPRTNDYKLLIVAVCKGDGSFEPYLFSLNGNCWKRVAANPPNSTSGSKDMTFVNGAVHWLGFRGRKNFGYNCAILGFDTSMEEFFEMKLPESLFGLCHIDLSIMKYGESSIAVTTHPAAAELHELWVMKEYGVVDSWTKVLTLHRVDMYAWIPRVLGFRKNGEVLLRVDDVKIASLDLNRQQMDAPLYLNWQKMELHGVEVGGYLQSVHSYVESLVLLDKAVKCPQRE
ncbi:hypothetical protein V6N12_042195 [Hibiscus sabdariffa]|uniref:F-box associated beta-propeller type 1 domain-containing protein n=1 Tax=Hibiscus sabdariffa TaxID=183260 RepID=A0ABR2EE30_9ROSI